MERLTDTIYRMRLDCPEIARASYSGQFVNLRVHESVVPLLRRPFSISRRHRGEGWFEVVWKVVGLGTRIMATRQPGKTMDVLGPLGRSFRLAASGSKAVLVGGGLGVAPLPFLCEELLAADVRVEVFLGARSAAELGCIEIFEELGVPVYLSTDDGTMGHRGFVTESLERWLASETDPTRVTLYACGPEVMLARIDEIARHWRLPAQISVETVMGCGFGICMGCAIPVRGGEPGGGMYKLACLDGPVFNAGEVILHG